MISKLLNGDRAVVDERKLRGYVLNPNHPDGAGKATLFSQLLGIDLSNWQLSRDELVRAAREDEAVVGRVSGYGQKYELRFQMTSGRGT